jgi:hypothetical protein
MLESVRKHRKWLECAAKWRNRRGNILILCLEVVQGGPINWNERNMHIGRGAAYHRGDARRVLYTNVECIECSTRVDGVPISCRLRYCSRTSRQGKARLR